MTICREYYDIESHIPIPPAAYLRLGGNEGWSSMRAIPLDDMNVGDSVFVPLEDRAIVNVRVAVCTFAKKDARRREFTVEGSEYGSRIWRIK